MPTREKKQRWLLGILLALCGVTELCAHETPIALLQLRETQAGSFLEAWTYSSSVNMEAPTPVYPDHCNYRPPRVHCGETGLIGPLTFEKLGQDYSAAVVRVRGLSGATHSYTLTAAQPVINLTASGILPWRQVAGSYLPLGFEHILLGLDHLLFVLGLMLLVASPWMLVKTITAFTIAHSITLAAATLGWVGVPERAVNAAIALSIVFVAVEIIKLWRGQPGLSARYPWAVAFGFGLLHGFGFAGALTDIGLPPENLPLALLFFNVGVELGQLAFVLLVLLLMRAHQQLQAGLSQRAQAVGVYALGAVASFWFIERMNMMVQAGL
ncbi:MAG: HupE/UreJ family protein [Pseudomonadota bacterium]